MANLPLTRRRRTRGFTLIELLVGIVMAGIVIGSVYQLLIAQSRSFGKQQELMDVHTSLRVTAAMLASEIRQASAVGGDFYTIDSTSVTLRSPQASAIICKRHPTQPRFGLVAAVGEFTAGLVDSALVFAANGPSPSDDAWHAMKIQSLSAGASMGVSGCEWAGSGPPQLVVGLVVGTPSDTAGVAVGGPLKTYRPVKYALYPDAGRWWLGRKVGASPTYEKLTGPFLPLASGGLRFTYYDAAGNITAAPAQVAAVGIVLRAMSHYVDAMGRNMTYITDTLAIRVSVRG